MTDSFLDTSGPVIMAIISGQSWHRGNVLESRSLGLRFASNSCLGDQIFGSFYLVSIYMLVKRSVLLALSYVKMTFNVFFKLRDI